MLVVECLEGRLDLAGTFAEDRGVVRDLSRIEREGRCTGWLLDGVRGSAVVAGSSAVGMFAAILLMALMRQLAPASVDTAGQAQNVYFALAQGGMGILVGAAVGAGVAWLAAHETGRPGSRAAAMRIGTPRGA